MTPQEQIAAAKNVLLKWPKELCTPKELIAQIKTNNKLRAIRSPLGSKIVLQIVGSWAYLLANVLNETQISNHDTLKQELRRLERHHRSHEADEPACPLLTLSNHISCIDDPILWGSLLPLTYYATNTTTVRWSMAAIEVCFSKPWHSTVFALGKTFPVLRGAGLDQPAMDFAQALLKDKQWLHLFPEGKVMRDANQQPISNIDRGYLYKWGTAKLILDYFDASSVLSREKLESDKLGTQEKCIRILPFYHVGMDEVLPIGRPYVPRVGKLITIYVRPSVINMTRDLLRHILDSAQFSDGHLKSRSRHERDRIKLTRYLESEVGLLMGPATQLHCNKKLN